MSHTQFPGVFNVFHAMRTSTSASTVNEMVAVQEGLSKLLGMLRFYFGMINILLLLDEFLGRLSQTIDFSNQTLTSTPTL